MVACGTTGGNEFGATAHVVEAKHFLPVRFVPSAGALPEWQTDAGSGRTSKEQKMSTERKPLSEQVMVITGASSGIGLATTLAAAKEGAKLVLAARSEATLNEIVNHITGEGGTAVAITADVGERADMIRVAETAISQFGRIDTWVNDAGISVYSRADEVVIEDSMRLFQTNFWGVVNGSLAALPHLKESGGVLINLGSEASEAVMPLQVMYSASKHAVKAFTDGLRMELEVDSSPVGVTLIQPTAVDTPFPEHAGNYLDTEPKLPTPMIAPEKVVAAILKAATKPKDAIKVGLMAKMDTNMSKMMPSLAEQMAKMQIGRQQRTEAPHTRQGTLYTPSEDGRIYGRGNENAASMKEARESNVRSA
jgi:short-subunit dehydrogenase